MFKGREPKQFMRDYVDAAYVLLAEGVVFLTVSGENVGLQKGRLQKTDFWIRLSERAWVVGTDKCNAGLRVENQVDRKPDLLPVNRDLPELSLNLCLGFASRTS